MSDDIRITSFKDTGLNDSLETCAHQLSRIAEALEAIAIAIPGTKWKIPT